ncbi:hypothetical protein PLEOSDRAFT_33109, partial [Pleurotus ostreatus PC15]
PFCRSKLHFSAPRFYCVETICAPCGVVIAWRKFAKGVAKILRFLEDIYADLSSRPSYIAIDKGCALLKHIVKQGHWPTWEPTTRIVVDSNHYINHRTTDHLCRTWCNPAKWWLIKTNKATCTTRGPSTLR